MIRAFQNRQAANAKIERILLNIDYFRIAGDSGVSFDRFTQAGLPWTNPAVEAGYLIVSTKIFSLWDVPQICISGVLAEFFLASLVDLIRSGNPGD